MTSSYFDEFRLAWFAHSEPALPNRWDTYHGNGSHHPLINDCATQRRKAQQRRFLNQERVRAGRPFNKNRSRIYSCQCICLRICLRFCLTFVSIQKCRKICLFFRTKSCPTWILGFSCLTHASLIHMQEESGKYRCNNFYWCHIDILSYKESNRQDWPDELYNS